MNRGSISMWEMRWWYVSSSHPGEEWQRDLVMDHLVLKPNWPPPHPHTHTLYSYTRFDNCCISMLLKWYWCVAISHTFCYSFVWKIRWHTEALSQVWRFCSSFCSRRYFRSTRMRATRSWLQTLKPSQALRFRKCWNPSCTRSTRGRSRVLLDKRAQESLPLRMLDITGLPHLVPLVWCGASS